MIPDISRINQVQAKILKNIIKTEIIHKKIGATQYDLSSYIPGSTFIENISKLNKRGLVELVKRPQESHHVWKKKSHRISKPYSVTTLGQLSLIQSISINELKDHELFQHLLPQQLKNHWQEIISLVDNEKYRGVFESLLTVLFFVAAKSISIEPTPEEIVRKGIGRMVLEKVNYPYNIKNSSHYSFTNTSSRIYGGYSKKEKILMDQEQKKLPKHLKILPLVFPNYDQITNNVIEKIVFLFYYHLLYYYSDVLTAHHIIVFMDFLEKNLEKMDSNERLFFHLNFTNYLDKERILAKICKIFLEDKEIRRIIENNTKELNQAFDKPNVLQFLNDILADKSLA